MKLKVMTKKYEDRGKAMQKEKDEFETKLLEVMDELKMAKSKTMDTIQ